MDDVSRVCDLTLGGAFPIHVRVRVPWDEKPPAVIFSFGKGPDQGSEAVVKHMIHKGVVRFEIHGQ